MILRAGARLALAVPLVAGGIAFAGATHTGPLAALCGEAAWQHRAALVVEHGDGQAVRVCIGFDAPAISVLDALDASGLEVGTTGFAGLGSAVCQIDHEPATYPPNCFTSSSPYWELFIARGGGSWTSAAEGASNETLANGDAAGFRYNPQPSGPAPVSATGTCPPAAASPSSPPAPSASSGRSTLGGKTPNPIGSAPTPALPTTTSPLPASITAPSTPGVVRVVAPARAAVASEPAVNAGLLLAFVGGGALVGLLGVAVLRGRRR